MNKEDLEGFGAAVARLPLAARRRQIVFQTPPHFGAGQPSLLSLARPRTLYELQEFGIGAERDGLEVDILEHDEGGDRLPIVGDHDRAAPGRLPNVGCQGLGRVGHLYFPDCHSSNAFLPIRTRFGSLIPMARMSTLGSGP